MKNAFDVPRIGYFKEGPMLRAQCKRLAGRSTVVGGTVFTFNDEGVCSVIDQANAKVDFETLCAQNGVSVYTDAPAVVAPVAPVAVKEELKAVISEAVDDEEAEEDDSFTKDKSVKSEKSDSKKKSGKK